VNRIGWLARRLHTSNLFLSQFKTAPVHQRIVDRAAALYRQWHPNHGLDINDAILAATTMEPGGQILSGGEVTSC